MHFCEFACLDSAILEEPEESFPPRRTVVKRSALTYSFHRVQIHFRANLTQGLFASLVGGLLIGPAK